MIPLNNSSFDKIATSLKEYDPNSAIPQIAGLLTVPELQANTVRIETLVHLAVAHCQGRSRLQSTDVEKVINSQSQIAPLEDCPGDVFVTNVEAPGGNFLIFQSIWESNDFFVQTVIDLLHSPGAPPEYKGLLIPVCSLLTLSDCVAKRVGLERWSSTDSAPSGKIKFPQAAQINRRSKSVAFSDADLNGMGIDPNSLDPFILDNQDKHKLCSETIGNSSLEQCPLLKLNDTLVLALPHAVSAAIRRFVLTSVRESGNIQEFSVALARRQAHQTVDIGLRELKADSELLDPIIPNGNVPSLNSLLLKYDTNKFIHVVLLHDHLDKLYEYGLGSFLEYTDEEESELHKYFHDVSLQCRSFPDFTEGITLVIVGGLGRGIMLSTPELQDPWIFSVLSIPDLIILGDSPRHPIQSYLKFLKYKKWAENKGVFFLNTNGDFNLYSYWLSNQKRLIPPDSPIAPGSVILTGDDFTQTIRKEIRTSLDRHLLQTVDGTYVPVMRLNTNSFFPSLHTLPIYGSLLHASKGQHAGAVETSRGTSWLLMTVPEDPTIAPAFGFHIWDGFISIYAKLIFTLEPHYSKAFNGVIAIYLNFEDVTSQSDPVEIRKTEPTITTNLNRRIAHIKFPADTLKHFQQSENVGERIIVRSMAQALTYLYQGGQDGIVEDHVAEAVNRVVGDSRTRIIHGFHPRNHVERLQMLHSTKCIDLDIGTLYFKRLLLSKGCGGTTGIGSIESKNACNQFLNCVVKKISKRLQSSLHDLDRSCLIRKVYELYESCLSDGEHWRRTENAMLSLYGETDDVPKIINHKKSERSSVSLALRTVMEMAICECPASGGKQVSHWEIDDLLADATLLIDTAMDSDTIHSNLLEPKLKLQANGEYYIDRSVYQTVILPFVSDYRETELAGTEKRYHELYESNASGDDSTIKNVWSHEFVHAFKAEFKLTLEDVRKCLAVLVEMAVEFDTLVVSTTLGNIRDRFARRDGLNQQASEAFMNTFGNLHRPSWETPPRGFENKDIRPWRFRRRLSATAKPIFIFGQQNDDPVIFGVSALCLGCWYLLEKTEDGRLPPDFYTSRQMIEYIGSINDERGHSFACSVAHKMEKKGWRVENEVKMSSLGASAELGDVDVLAWKSHEEIQIIECKRLRLPRTPREVADICRRFQGETKDELDKHIQRVKWIKNNPESLKRIVGNLPDSHDIDHRFITSTHLPLKYLQSLPIDPAKIGPLE